MRKSATLVLFALLLAGVPLSRTMADLDRNTIDIEHYALEFSLKLDGDYVFQNSMSGKASIRFRNIGQEKLEQVPFLLNRLFRYESVVDGEGHELLISHKLLEVANFEFFQANAGVVTLHQPLDPGQSIELVLDFGGRLTGYADAGMLYTKEILDPEFTILRSEVLVYPQIAKPDWLETRKGWADEFTWQATFDVPASHIDYYLDNVDGDAARLVKSWLSGTSYVDRILTAE